MKLYIKNMVCSRCERAVQLELEKMHLPITAIKLGEVTLSCELTKTQKTQLSQALQQLGFRVLEDEQSKTIAQIKNAIIDLVHYQDQNIKTNLSTYLSTNLNQDYSALSKLFSDKENQTIAHYFIVQKIEKAKELLDYKELSLSEIAHKLNYSNVAHLSNQFKKITGSTPTFFKKNQKIARKSLDIL
ncbi:helix-turn-helix transcriptional regulator [Flavobacterium crassostreae]|uniref:AraC family transcriptional regulator n=1 Tax=Flavobacterium crassostreae TaxID=1763534 RepID=A0A1B9DXJ7_9FLAO|nr:helix-turn-helix transcriptional regulator [Flavobacterium crassostreae]OCB74405.1 AraC family transcriptional regulator [Flavobacterium crassostreae]